MDMFIFLLGRINLLLLFLLTSLQISGEVEVGIVLDCLKRAEVAALVDYSASWAACAFEQL